MNFNFFSLLFFTTKLNKENINSYLMFTNFHWLFTSFMSQSDINALENVQRYFTNRIPGCVFLPYKQRLSILSLDSLHKRRVVADLVCFYSIMSGSLNSFLSPHIKICPPSVSR